MKRRNLWKIPAVLALAASSLVLSLSGCKDFSFYSELGSKGGLSISPSNAVIATSSSLVFHASGGSEPYTFGIATGGGSIDPATGKYDAPSAPEAGIVVSVTDSEGNSATADVEAVGTVTTLQISPTVASITPDSTITFAATGGVAPYTFDFQTNNSGGSISPGGDYQAGPTAGVSDTIIVTDSDTPTPQTSVPATVTVLDTATNVDYNIYVDTFPAAAEVGDPITGDFTLHNDGTATGTANIAWWLFIDEDATFGGDGVHLVAGNAVTNDIGPSADEVVAPAGNWPVLSQGTYDLFVMISSPDDSNHVNNIYYAGTIDLDVPDVDYYILSVSNTGETHVGGPISAEFDIDNQGTEDGTLDFTWKAYVSDNTSVDVGDTLIDSNTDGAMSSAEAPRTILFSGTWPSSPGMYYLLVEITALDDEAAGNDGNNVSATGWNNVQYPDIDYQVQSVTHLSGAHAGGTVDGELDLRNSGSDDGASDVIVEVYASTDVVVGSSPPDPPDTLVYSVQRPALGAGVNAVMPFSGTWPVDPNPYYLVVKVSAFDETLAGNDLNNTTATVAPVPVAVADVDYYADTIGSPGGLVGDPMSCNFTLHNTGADDSTSTVAWSLYASTNPLLDGGDYLAASGTAGPLVAGGFTDIIDPAGATWPATPGSYYLIVVIASPEDAAAGNDGNDVAVSGGSFTAGVPDVDYFVDSFSGSDGPAGGPISCSFTVHNLGSNGGVQSVPWNFYLSTNPTLDAGDYLSATGTTGPLPAGGFTTISDPAGATWPPTPGSYYLIVEVESPEDVAAGNDGNDVAVSAGTRSAVVADIDYFVDSFASAGGLAGDTLSCSFRLHNGGTDDSTVPSVPWGLYLSTNPTLDAGDYLAASGTSGALVAGGFTDIVNPAGATWPATPGDYYIIVEIESPEDVTAGNDANDVAVSGATYPVTAPDVDYFVDSITSSGGLIGDTLNCNFTLHNAGGDDSTALFVPWSLYLSANTVLDAGDYLAASGSSSPLAAGGSSAPINPAGANWPATPGNYYIIVDIESPEDVAAGNDANDVAVSGATYPATAPDIDYVADSITSPGGFAGDTLSCSFDLHNDGTDDSASTVNWYLYASANLALDAGDHLAASGTAGPLLASAFVNIVPAGATWPTTPGDYHLIVEVESTEDVAAGNEFNDVGVSGATYPAAPPDVNYFVHDVVFNAGGSSLMPDGTVGGVFEYDNIGGNNGGQAVTWEVYASLDTAPDAGDTLVDSGTGLPLDAGGSSGSVPFVGRWPLDYGQYYLVARVMSSQEVYPADNRDCTVAPIAVGYFAETPEQTSPFTDYNDDWTNLVDVDKTGVTLKPGMSVRISASMSANDYDDIFEFDLDPATTVVTATATWQNTLAPAKTVTMWFFIGPGADSDGFGGLYVAGTDEITVNWTPNSLPNSPFPTFWLDLENSDLTNLGITGFIVSAH